MKIEDLKRLAIEQKAFLLLAGGVIVSQAFFHFSRQTQSAKVAQKYIMQSLSGRIDTILYYTRGFPKVTLSSGETLVIYVPYAGQKYLQAGDSVVKKAGTENITTYRKLPEYTEISLFREDSSDNEGLSKRYRIPIALPKGQL